MVRITRASPADAASIAALNQFVHELHVEHAPDFFRRPTDAEALAAGFQPKIHRYWRRLDRDGVDVDAPPVVR